MSIRTVSIVSLTATVMASVVLALLLFAVSSISSVASAAEEIPAVAQVAAEDLNEQPRADTTQLPPSQPQMFNNDDDVWNGWWIIMPIMMVVFWGGIIALVVWGVRQFTQGRASDRSPLDIAKARLAKGEISSDEFEGICSHLV